MKWLFFTVFLFFSVFSRAEIFCEFQKNPMGIEQFSLDQLKKQCLERKSSSQCQKIYEQIKADGGKVKDKELRCDTKKDLISTQEFSFSPLGCLQGGLVGGIVMPVQKLGEFLGETAAKTVLSLQKDFERQSYCDKHPEMKKKMYETLNQSLPQLLKIEIPKNILSKSCAQIEADITTAKGLKERTIAQKVDFKNFQTNPQLSPSEVEYLKWKFKNRTLAPSQDWSLIELADQALKKYNIHIDCYNRVAQSYLRCEMLFNLATIGFAGGATVAKSLSVLSGLKVERFVSTVQKISEAGSGLKSISTTEQIEILSQANNLNRAERIKASETLLGRKLESVEFTNAQGVTEKINQADALMKAHQLPLKQLKKKAEILSQAGYSKEERELLMRTGITGEMDEFIQASKIALAEEQESFSQITKLESQKAQLQNQKKPGLSESQNAQIDKDIANLDEQISLESQKIRGSGVGRSESSTAAKTQQRIGMLSRQIEIAEANESSTAALRFKRSQYLQDLSDQKLKQMDYASASKNYSRAADDVSKAVESSALQSFRDKTQAAYTLESAGVSKSSDAYQKLLTEIARSPQIKNNTLDLQKLEFAPSSNASSTSSISASTSGSASTGTSTTGSAAAESIKLIQELKNQSLRVEVQRIKNEDAFGYAWDSNKKLNQQFESMIDQRELLRTQLEHSLSKELGTTGRSRIPQIMQQLGF